MAVTKKLEVFKCAVCGNIVEVLAVGGAALVCCGQEMNLLAEQSAEAGTEKHLPVVERKGNGILVKVGSIPHPMLPEHSIQWIEVLTADGVWRKELIPGHPPEAEFEIKQDAVIAVRELCNLHGLWKKA